MNFDNGSFGPFASADYDEILELLQEDLDEREISEHGKIVRMSQLKTLIDQHRPEYYQEHHQGLQTCGEAFGASVMYVNAKRGRVSLERLVVAQSGNCFTADEATGVDDEFIMPPGELETKSLASRTQGSLRNVYNEDKSQ